MVDISGVSSSSSLPSSSPSPSPVHSPSATSMNLNSERSSSRNSANEPSRPHSLEWNERESNSHLASVIDESESSSNNSGVYPILKKSPSGTNGSSNEDMQQLLHPGHNVTSEEVILTHHEHTAPKSSINSSVFVLSATTLGAGILALPYAFMLLGYIFGSVLLLAVGFTSSYAIRLLLSTARSVGATTYEDLGDAIFPRFGKRMVVTTTLVLIFGSLTAFFVVIADTITPSVQNITGNTTSFFVKREVLLVLVALLIVFPLCMLRSIHALERWSFLAVGIILVVSFVVVIDAGIHLHDGTAAPDSDGNNPDFSANVKPFTLTSEVFEALPIIALAFTCQTMLFPIWNSLQGESINGIPSLSPAPVASMLSVANRSLVLCGILYLPVGLFGFFCFGLNTNSDLLNNFPTKTPFYDAVRIFFTCAICIHYPVVQFGFRSVILTTWYATKTVAQNSRRFVIITVVTVFFSLLLAIALPNLSTVFGLTGALCAFPYCYIFPTLFYLRLHSPNAEIKYIGHVTDETTPTTTLPSTSRRASTADRDYQRLPNPTTNAVVEVVVDGRHSSQQVYQPIKSTTVAPPNSSSPLLFGRGLLSLKQKIPAYLLLTIASMLWVSTVIVSFKDMVAKFQKDGI